VLLTNLQWLSFGAQARQRAPNHWPSNWPGCQGGEETIRAKQLR